MRKHAYKKVKKESDVVRYFNKGLNIKTVTAVRDGFVVFYEVEFEGPGSDERLEVLKRTALSMTSSTRKTKAKLHYPKKAIPHPLVPHARLFNRLRGLVAFKDLQAHQLSNYITNHLEEAGFRTLHPSHTQTYFNTRVELIAPIDYELPGQP